MNINIEISLGEFFDKLTILQIKQVKITDAPKLDNIKKELGYLRGRLADARVSADNITGELDELRALNEALWDIEDHIREKEAHDQFDEVFVELARSVYFTNDKRAAVKRAINEKLGSSFVEEKSYASYECNTK